MRKSPLFLTALAGMLVTSAVMAGIPRPWQVSAGTNFSIFNNRPGEKDAGLPPLTQVTIICDEGGTALTTVVFTDGSIWQVPTVVHKPQVITKLGIKINAIGISGLTNSQPAKGTYIY